MQYIPRYISLCDLLYVFIDRFISLPLFLLFMDENTVGSWTQSHLHRRNTTADISRPCETSCWRSWIPAICVSKLGNRFLYSSSCYTLQSHTRTFPCPLTPSLHYTPNSSVSKTLWQRESQPWPLKFPVMAACHPCIVEPLCQGLRFHTITAHTQTDTFSPSRNIPHSPVCCLCLGLWSRSRGSACPVSILHWNGNVRKANLLQRVDYFSTRSLFYPVVTSSSCHFRELRIWDHLSSLVAMQAADGVKEGSQEVKLGCKEGRRATKCKRILHSFEFHLS